jgi:hypothetical protein
MTFFHSQSINGAVIVTSIILVAEPHDVSAETRKRSLFSLLDYNHLQTITFDELVLVSSSLPLSLPSLSPPFLPPLTGDLVVLCRMFLSLSASEATNPTASSIA